MDIFQNAQEINEYQENLGKLIDQINSDRCCAFVGAGVSKHAGYPLLKPFIEKLLACAEEIRNEEVDISKIADFEQIEYLRQLIGEENYKNLVVENYRPEGKNGFISTHYAIMSIPFTSWITTNYDLCLENAAAAAFREIPCQHYPELNGTRLKEHHIFHIHGLLDPNHPDYLFKTLVLSRRDYEDAYRPQSNLLTFLNSVCQFYSLVFIGYSLWDLELVNIIKLVQFEIQRRSEFEIQANIGRRKPINHFLIMHNEGKVNTDAVKELGILPIVYKGDADHHSELEKVLDVIRGRTTSLNYPPVNIVRDVFEDGFHV